MTVTVNLEKQQAIELYSKMLLIRRFEEESERLYRRGMIRGFLHTYIGEEAIAVGAVPLLRTDDYVISHYRDHGHALARGMDPKTAMAELCGKSTGSSGGKGGSMHLFDAEKHFMGGHAIVGGQLPLAVGMALGIKQKGLDSVVMCFFGDGAVNEGEFHEAMNLASLWKLPVVFMLENNLYGMGTHVERTHAAGRNIFTSADSYNIQSAQIDGMDVLKVQEASSEALKRIRSGEGPMFIEALGYRFHGHSITDPQAYRDDSEVIQWQEKDPIDRLKRVTLADGIMSDEDFAQIESEIDSQVQEAIQFADESDEPSPDALYENVYAG